MNAFTAVASLTLLSALAVPMSAQAARAPAALAACSFDDLTGVTVTACTGFLEDNLLKGSTGSTVSATIAAQLTLLGVANASSSTYVEKIGSNGGLFTIDFTTPLAGDTVIGLHLGGGSDKFSSNVPGGATAFYKFDAGTNLDSFGLASYMTASSGVAVFQTTAVPEPETYALMLAGLVAVSFVARRRQA